MRKKANMEWPEGKDWVAALAITTPYGQSTEWPKTSPLTYAAPDFAELITIDYAPTVATKLPSCHTDRPRSCRAMASAARAKVSREVRRL
jgi:hypothetical protein